MKELIKNSNEIPFEREVLSKRTEKPEKTIPCKISDRERLSKDEITLERRTVYLEQVTKGSTDRWEQACLL